MRAEEMEKCINCVVQEGLDGITSREYRANKAISLEGNVQARYFSEIRNDMNSLAANRVMTVGVNQSANTLFKELDLYKELSIR